MKQAREPRPNDKLGPAPGSESTTLQPGDGVICKREAPAKGSWHMYDGRIGVVRTINQMTNDRRDWNYVEIGVAFTRSTKLVWFRADELQPHELPAWFDYGGDM